MALTDFAIECARDRGLKRPGDRQPLTPGEYRESDWLGHLISDGDECSITKDTFEIPPTTEDHFWKKL